MNSNRCVEAMRLLSWISVVIFILISFGCAQDIYGRKVVGETARISLADAGIEYLARIDTGARITSVHALDMEVPGG